MKRVDGDSGYGRFIGLILAGVVLLSASGCRNAEADLDGAKKKVVRPVKAIRLEASAESDVRTFPGSAKAVREVNLAFRVGGPLVAVNGDTGDRVTKGDVLASIDPRDFDVNVKTLNAALAASRASFSEAALQYERYRELVDQRAAAKATYDQVKATWEMAAAQVEADTKRLEAAKNALADTVLTAPFTGYIHERLVENHETVTAGQPIFSVVDLSGIEVEIGIPESLIGQTDRFSAFSCIFDSLHSQAYAAKLKEIGKQPNAASRTYPMTLTLEPDAVNRVRPGMSAEVNITLAGTDTSDHFTVPLASVVNRDRQQTFVWIVDDAAHTVHKCPVKFLGLSKNGAVITGDLQAGVWVVAAGASYLKEGQETRILKPESETNIGQAL